MSLLRKGTILLLLGVLLGSSCAFLAVSLGASAVNKLVDSLFEEATGCQAHFEEIRFLVLQGKAEARDGRVICSDVKVIEIPEASVRVQFRPLFSRRLALELEFSEGIIRGFLEDSALYRLIDFFVKQPRTPPEEWKVLVPRLVINNASVLEEFGQKQFFASRVNFELRDQEFGPLDLEVNVGEAFIRESVKNGEHTEETPLGSSSAVMSVENKKFKFSKLDFIRGNSRVRAKGQIDTAAENRIEGSCEFTLNLAEAGFGEYSSGTLAGEGQIEGTIEEPMVRGHLRTDPHFVLKNPAEGLPEVMVEKSEAAFLLDFVDRAFRFSFHEGFVSSSGAKLSFNKPLQLTAQGFSGEIGLDFSEFAYGPLEIPSGEATLALSGTYAEPEVKLTAELASLISAGVRFAATALLAEISARKLRFEASLKGDYGGEVLVSGSTTFSGSAPQLEDGKYTVSEMITPLSEGVGQEDERPVVRTSSRGTIEGHLTAGGFLLRGEFVSVLDGLPVKDQFAGTIRAENGLLHLAAKNKKGEIEIRGNVPLIGESSAHLEAEIENYDLSSLLPENICASFSASGFYDFSTAAPTQGSGKIFPTQLNAGCGQGALQLVQSEELLFNSGRLDFSRIRLASQGKQLEASGSYSIGGEAQIKLYGDFNLELLLPFLGMLDDLSGAVALEADLKVSDEIFQLDGRAELKQGGLTLNSADVDVQDINGFFSFSPEKVVIERIDGKINGGQLHVSGNLNLKELQQSTLNTGFSRVELYPSENSHVVLSGALRLETADSRRPLVSGDVQIVRAEMKQQLESTQLMELLLKTLLSLGKNSTGTGTGSEQSALEEVDLDVNVRAEDSVYLISNWGAAELKADLSVVGQGNKPEISGKMETLSGWFGFRNRKFAISSGRILFKPGEKEPLLELYAQTTVRTPAAELVQVFLEARGRVSEPKVSLSSDFGYSEQELLSLIAFAGDAVAEEAQSLVSFGILSSEEDAAKKQMLGGVRQLVRKLTLLDSLVLEPAYDDVTGVVEPKLVARKRLSDSINLRLEELYGQTTGGSLVAVDYEASPKLTLSGRMEPATDRKEESLGVDASFIIEADSFGFLVLQLNGNDNVSRSAILEALKIGSRSVLNEKEVPRLASELRDFYVKQGYFEAKVVAECRRGGDLCREVMLKISEGPLFVVGGALLSGELGSEEKRLEKRLAKVKHQPSSESVLQTLRLEILKALRKKDYLQARVRVEYRDGGREFEKLAAVDVDLGRPVYFSLSGNSFYSQKKLLTEAKVYDRELPFGRNSIRLLAEAILELYRREGFADVSLTYQRAPGKSGEAEHYNIVIKEGARVRVEAVELQGNNSLSTAKISQILKGKGKDQPQEFFSPTYLVLSELKRHESLLRQIYIEEGYPKASVSQKIKRSDGGQKATVTFVVEEGKQVLFSSVEVLGFPEDIPLPRLPDDKITTMVVEEYRSLVESTLRDYGCVEPTVLLTVSTEQRALISVSPGVRVKVADVVISGRSYSREEAIRGNLLLGPGDYWIGEKIRESRARLLRLGLFSRVEIGPGDGALNTAEETLLVKVFEREPKVSSVGVGYDSVDGIRLFGEQTDRSLLGDGRSLTLKVDGFYDPNSADISRGVASARYADPYAFGSLYRWTEDLRFLRLENDFLPFDTDRVSLGSYLERKLSSRIDFGLGHSIFFEDLKSVSPDVVLGPYDNGQLRLSFLLANIGYTNYDDVLNPSRGFRLASYGRVASKVLASEASYATWGGRGAFVYTLPFAPSLSLANNTHGASSWPYGDSNSIPISQRFFLGGYSSVRGYKENSLGPRGVDGGVQGGDLMLLNNLEFRWQFYESFSVLTFLDVGGVYLRDESVAADELRRSTGFGFRYLSPVGPIGFDVGFPLERRPDEPSARFHFSVGTLF